MKKLRIIAIIALIISFGLTAMSQQKVYKIKPIKGKKNAIIQNQDLGTGMTKWNVSLERLSGQASDIYLPSDALVMVEGNGYNPPNPSNSIKVNSAKTADGFLFNAKGPKNNNIQIHLKKSASSNSSYTMEVNLRQGEKYEFPIYYLPNQYLMIRGSSNDYENMVSSISSNQYFTESLSYVDDEFAKYQSEPNLVWWAEAFVGVFQDYVDVEAIGQILPTVNFSVFSFESLTDDATLVEWVCDGQNYSEVMDNGELLLVVAEGNCSTAAIPVPMGSWTFCSEAKCPPSDYPNTPDGYAEWLACINRCLWHYGNDIIPGGFGLTCKSVCDLDYYACLESGVSSLDCSQQRQACKEKCGPSY